MNSAFFYVYHMPARGMWIDLDAVRGIDDVLARLVAARLLPVDDLGDPHYFGDLLVADVDGILADAFMDSGGSFDLDGFIEARDFCEETGCDKELAAAYVYEQGRWNRDDFLRRNVKQSETLNESAH